MVEKHLLLPLDSIEDCEANRTENDGLHHLGLLASKVAERVLERLLRLHPIHVIAAPPDHKSRKPWIVVAGWRTLRLARLLAGHRKVPVIILSAPEAELTAVDDVVSVLMFAESLEAFWGRWEKYREDGVLAALGRDLDEVRHVEAILGRKRPGRPTRPRRARRALPTDPKNDLSPAPSTQSSPSGTEQQ